jgi:hypothetical protein
MLQNPHFIAQIALAQLKDVLDDDHRSIIHLFLHEPFALGYAIGFVEQAFRHAKNENDDENCTAYLLEAISTILGDAAVAASFVTFAVSKKGERIFEGGYDVGSSDMEAWCTSQKEYIPNSLSRHLGADPQIRHDIKTDHWH